MCVEYSMRHRLAIPQLAIEDFTRHSPLATRHYYGAA